MTALFLGILWVIASLWLIVYSVWNRNVIHDLSKNGTIATATIIDKYNSRVYYDIEYDGCYYRGSIRVGKKAFRKIRIGERFYGLVLPEKLKRHRNNGITPQYFGITLEPLPENCQNIDEECSRIDSMYKYRNNKTLLYD